MSQAGFDIPIVLEERHGLARPGEAIRIGVPLAKGLLFDTAGIVVMTAAGDPVPHQAKMLMQWPDQSIKWMLLDAVLPVPANTKTTLRVRPAVDSRLSAATAARQVAVTEQVDHFVVDTGVARFTVNKSGDGPFASASLGDRPLLRDGGSRWRWTAVDGSQRTLAAKSVVIEEAGPVRVTLLAQGSLQAGGAEDVLRFSARLVFIAGLAAVTIEFLIHNPRAARHPGGLWDLGDSGSLLFRDLSLCLYPSTARKLRWYADTAGEVNVHAAAAWTLYQDSSGGARWNSKNHLNGNGASSVSFRGYRVCAGRDGQPIAEGLRAQPCLGVLGDAGWVAATAADFWQNFPKSLRWTEGELAVGLFPSESTAGFELQGGEQKRHKIYVDFGAAVDSTVIPQLQHPLAVALDPAWVEQTRAVSWFVPQEHDSNEDYLRYIGNIVAGPQSFLSKREVIDEYGWRNFGDLYADHEAVRYTGDEPLVSHYNNQYDFICGALVHFLRSGDDRWRSLMEDAARHTIDIDIYHTQADKSAFNGGLFWHTDHHQPAATCTHRTYSGKNGGRDYGGGPSNEHNYTSGLLGYYLLTGDLEARNAVLTLAEWVIAMDDGARTLHALVEASPTGYASKTVSESFHKVGRGAGNSINALLDAYLLSRDQRYMTKAQELIERCIHPSDDIDALELTEPENRWSYLVFLQVLAKFLGCKTALGETDYAFHYARDSLMHYARWMLEHEAPYKDVLHKVLLPTETWPAHDVRKCHILHVAATYARPDERERFHARAAYFFKRCVDDVSSFQTALLTRPLVILCVYGYVHAYFQAHPDEVASASGSHGYVFGAPAVFVPQKMRVRRALREKFRVAGVEARRLMADALSSVTRSIRGNRGRA